ncbi:MAG TPA: outer membrane lipoprotein-sorting protein [Patescibacteria group bacterium]|nr:outer membrane lipoprotein-sorting protein [Patescibacteria group bacterium]
MKKKAALCLALAAVFALPAAAQTVDEIIAKNMEARGGEAKLRAVKAVRMTGKIEVGPGMVAPMVMMIKRPEMVRMEFTVQGMTAVQAYDGKDGWGIMPFQGKKDAEPMSADDAKLMEAEGDLDGPLVDYKSKGNSVEYLGKEKVEGSDAYKLRVTRKNGIVETSFIDVDSGLEVKTITKAKVHGNETEEESMYSDFRTVDGLVIPFAIESGTVGGTQKQKITVEKVEFNPDLSDSQFHMPAAAPAEQTKPGASR